MLNIVEPSPDSPVLSCPEILVVEDDPGVRDVLEAQLEFSGFSPVCVENADDALDWLAKHQPALAILDLMLPGRDGISLCQHIRGEHSLSHLPILMISALGNQVDTRIRGLVAGANDFLAKPYNLGELIAKIHNLLKTKAEGDRMEGLLSRYIAPPVRARIRSGLDVLSQRKNQSVAVQFADLRGYTHFSTRTDPDKLACILDQFFESMIAIIHEHGGLALDLSGDELLAIYDTGNHAASAIGNSVSAAISMQKKFVKLQDEWARAGASLGLGIGIHHGPVMLGDVGCQDLSRFTVIGNVVNIAHRLVEVAKPGEIVVTEEVFHGAESTLARLGFVAGPAVLLKGIEEPQRLYKLPVTNRMPTRIRGFSSALKAAAAKIMS